MADQKIAARGTCPADEQGYNLPDAYDGKTLNEWVRMLSVGGVLLEDIEQLERLCELGRHARHLRMRREGRLPLVCRGRLVDREA